jgi:hypothetical protein
MWRVRAGHGNFISWTRAAFIESVTAGAISVRVKYDEHQELDVPEDRYRARGYQPPFDKLPWKDEAANDT